MTRIDFHSNIGDRIAYVCRLTRKAYAAKHRIVLLSRDRRERDAIDQALWIFSAHDFLAHAAADDPLVLHAPIVLAERDTDELPHHQLLINLSDRTPTHFARFGRVIEIVGRNASEVSSGRQRWLFYKERGYPLNHHVIEDA